MAEVKIYYNKLGNTLTVWFSHPHEEYICEETGDEVILMKNKSGVVIGFEKLNYSLQESINPSANHKPTMIKDSENDVIMISKEDWAAIEETIYLNSIHGYIDSLKEVMTSPRNDWVNAQELGL